MQPQFPPLFRGLDFSGRGDPTAQAIALARQGTDAGLVVYDLAHDRLAAAIVFAPEVPLTQAAQMMPVCGVGFQNALGSLAPPEVGVHLEWGGGLRVNGGLCGRIEMHSSTTAPQDIPDWLVIGLSLDLWPAADIETGRTPDRTALYAEGCGEVEPVTLLEAWTRHTLLGLNGWMDGGTAALYREWAGLAHGLDADVTVAGHSGTALGVDEDFGLLLKDAETTHLIPLTALVKDAS